jgi:AbrB family looped-hinge helix DNA binding protein
MPKLTSRWRVTIPAKVRATMQIRPGDRVEFVEVKKGQFVMTPLKPSVRELEGMFKKK